jgi:hypothetical protein
MTRAVRAVVIACVIICALLATVFVLTISSPKPPKPIVQSVSSGIQRTSVLDESLGFPFWITLNLEWPGLEAELRHIFIFMDKSYFSEENLRRLFEHLAETYQDPTLFIDVRTDEEALREAINISSPHAVHYNPINEPSKAVASSLPQKAVLWARYNRVDGKEEFTYTDPDKAKTVRIVLRNSKKLFPPYTGDLNTDLLLAAKEGDSYASRIKEVLSEGADINTRDKGGNTPLMLAIWFGNKEAFGILMVEGSNVNLQNAEGWTALHFAATKEDIQFLRELLERGADINAKNKTGNTALMLSAARGFKQHVVALLEAGADVDAKNFRGETALTRARYGEIAELLKQAKAKQ